MKYKTLFRLLLKFLGVWVFVGGLEGAVRGTLQLTGYGLNPGTFGAGLPAWLWTGIVAQLVPLVFGLYLFFGGEWIVNLAIPSNRPYCPNCGYDLSRSPADRCQECGTATPSPGDA